MKEKLVTSIDFPEQGTHLVYLDYLKIIAAFAVVMTHIASIGWQALPVQDGQWFITSVYEIATRFCVPIFFLCSGAILLNPNKIISTSRLIRRYIIKTVCIAIGVSVLYVGCECVFAGWMGFRAFFSSVASGPYFIWYLWALVCLYILTPFLKKLVEDQRMLTGLILVFLFFVIGKSTANTMFPGSPFTLWMNEFLLFSDEAEGIFYYLLGAWLVSHKFSRSLSFVIYIAGAICLVLAIVFNYQYSLINGWDLYYVNRGNILIAIFSVAVFELFRQVFSESRIGKLGSWIVSCGLMIYLIHPFFRLLFESVDQFSPLISLLYTNALVGVPVVSALVYVLSLASASIIKRSGLIFRKSIVNKS